MTIPILFCITLAVVLSLVLVPTVRWLAIRIGMIDHPDAVRKLHLRPIALGGGIGVFAALAISFAGTILVDRQFWGGILGAVDVRYYWLFGAAAAILLVGLFDDLFDLRGRQKLLCQILIIAALVGSGTKINVLGLFGYELHLGGFAFPITVLWLVIAVNALNLIDGADGMASTVGAIICFGLGCLSMQVGATFNGLVCFALSGALGGFLVFNRPPATIYLGDAGSMMIGLFVGVLSVWTNLKESTMLSSAPIAILALPLFDSSAAILRRWLTGRSIYATDRAHLHHLLQERYGHGRMLLFVAFLCGTTTLLSVLSNYFNVPALAGLGVLIVLALLVLTRSFGYAEVRLVLGQIAGIAQSFTISPARIQDTRQHSQIPLQGTGDWETVWEPLVLFAKNHGLARIKLDLNLAWLQEGYHASWQSIRMPEKSSQLNLGLPLFAHQPSTGRRIQIGRLSVVAGADVPTIYDCLATLGDYLQDLSGELDAIVAKLELRRGRRVAVIEQVAVARGEPVSAFAATPLQQN